MDACTDDVSPIADGKVVNQSMESSASASGSRLQPLEPENVQVNGSGSNAAEIQNPPRQRSFSSASKEARQPPTLRTGSNTPVIRPASRSTSSPLGGAACLPADLQAKMEQFQKSRIPNLNAIERPEAQSWASDPSIRRLSPKPSLGSRRGMKLPLSGTNSPNPVTGQMKGSSSMFSNFSNIIDTSTGTLNFAGKASVHSKGIDFSTGNSYKISRDEMDDLGELGKGNYGTVHRVLHRPTGVTMAMKAIRLELDHGKLNAIIMELDILHKAVAPQIVEFYGAFFVEGAVGICMEYMDGGSMEKLYAGGVEEGVLAKVATAVVTGLRVLKDEHNIIHRDVKPTNILLNTKGQIKLADFGVSGNLVASIAKTNIGCQSYMAPERIKSNDPTYASITYTVHSDIWSLGLSLLEIANGHYPYPPETYNNIFSQLQAIVEGEPPTLPEVGFSRDAQDFIRQCLNKSPDLRPSYSTLLQHPWIRHWLEKDVPVNEWVSKRIMSHTLGNTSNADALVPALHRVTLNRE